MTAPALMASDEDMSAFCRGLGRIGRPNVTIEESLAADGAGDCSLIDVAIAPELIGVEASRSDNADVCALRPVLRFKPLARITDAVPSISESRESRCTAVCIGGKMVSNVSSEPSRMAVGAGAEDI